MSDTKKRTQNKRRRRKYRLTMRFYGILTALFVIIVGVVLSKTLFFNITDIQFENTSPYSLEEILVVTQIHEGDNLFSMNLTKRSENLEKCLPYAGEVIMKRKLPSTIKITVKAPEIDMNIATGDGKFYLISDEKKVLEKNLAKAVSGYPIIYGYEPADVNVCGTMTSESKNKKELIEEIFAAFDKNGFDNLASVDVTNINEIMVRHNEVQSIRLGNSDDIDFKIELAKAIVDKRSNPNEPGTINVESTQYPTFIGEHNGIAENEIE